MKTFIGSVVDRTQYALLQETLEDSITRDHPVRVLDWVLDRMDWSEWIARYPGGGRPAYPPDVMVKLLAYAYMTGMRSSRIIEHACRNSMDFMWLMSGRKPDHDTIASFRRENIERFVDVFQDGNSGMPRGGACGDGGGGCGWDEGRGKQRERSNRASSTS